VKQEGVIAVIEPDKTEQVTISGFVIPEEALSKEVTLKVTAGPVEGEAVETNNSASFKLLLQLQ
jgi:co-chaperonin GroES (HSP10)